MRGHFFSFSLVPYREADLCTGSAGLRLSAENAGVYVRPEAPLQDHHQEARCPWCGRGGKKPCGAERKTQGGGETMNTKAGDFGFLLFEQSRRGSLRRVLVATLVILGLILYVGAKIRIVQLGYQIEAMEHEKKDLERSNRSLRIETSSLSSPARIEAIALKRLGMVRPPKENVVAVKRKEDTANPK